MSTATSKSPKTSSDRKPNLKGQAKVKLLPSNVAAVGHSLDIFLDDNDTSSESFNAILVHELVLPVIAQVLQSFFERVFKEVYGVEFVDSSEIDLSSLSSPLYDDKKVAFNARNIDGLDITALKALLRNRSLQLTAEQADSVRTLGDVRNKACHLSEVERKISATEMDGMIARVPSSLKDLGVDAAEIDKLAAKIRILSTQKREREATLTPSSSSSTTLTSTTLALISTATNSVPKSGTESIQHPIRRKGQRC